MNGMRSGDAIIDALADAVRGRVDERRRAQERLASFAFRETDAPATNAAESRSEGGQPVTVWSVHLARVLRAAADPTTLELLERLRVGPRMLDEAEAVCRAGGDRLAAATWIGDLAANGLVSHELATDRVELTPLGAAILDLVDEVARRADHGRPDRDRAAAGPAGAGR